MEYLSFLLSGNRCQCIRISVLLTPPLSRIHIYSLFRWSVKIRLTSLLLLHRNKYAEFCLCCICIHLCEFNSRAGNLRRKANKEAKCFFSCWLQFPWHDFHIDFFFFSPPPCIFLLELHSLSYLCNCLCVSCWVCVGKIFDLRQIDTHELIKKWFVIAYKCIRNFHIFQNQKKVALSVYFKWLSLRKVSEACITLQQ